MSSLEPFLKRSLVILLFLGLTEACVPRQVAMEEKIKLLKGIVGLMSRLSPDGFRQNIISSSKTSPLVTTPDRTEEEMKILKQILGLLSLQVLNEETSNCKEEVKSSPATTTAKALVRSSGWSFWRCAYMMVTFLFVSYNKGDWCYCHYCNPDLDLRVSRQATTRAERPFLHVLGVATHSPFPVAEAGGESSRLRAARGAWKPTVQVSARAVQISEDCGLRCLRAFTPRRARGAAPRSWGSPGAEPHWPTSCSRGGGELPGGDPRGSGRRVRRRGASVAVRL
ncbi:epididymal protein 13 [Meriones unguiculatus]|uniref:epididymal protein 13 n=1 Tax=Meriones unguiculatus TaxID=10047 RepID=UPI00293F5CBD|nr:epididymal protein 13 [Meriones unguiculatus]